MDMRAINSASNTGETGKSEKFTLCLLYVLDVSCHSQGNGGTTSHMALLMDGCDSPVTPATGVWDDPEARTWSTESSSPFSVVNVCSGSRYTLHIVRPEAVYPASLFLIVSFVVFNCVTFARSLCVIGLSDQGESACQRASSLMH